MAQVSKMVERVARVIVADHFPATNTDETWRGYEHVARAVIEAMREPTDKMVRDGVFSDNTLESMPHITYEDSCRNIWRAMIDAALAE